LTARIFIKLILGVVGVLAVALTAVDYLVTQRVETTFFSALERELTEKARTIALSLSKGDGDFPTLGAAVGARVTWVASDGRVLGDSEASPDRMENHRNRPEIQAALDGRRGSAIRTSGTLGVPFFYLAIPYGDTAIRLAVPSDEIQSRVNTIRRGVILSTTFAFLPSILLAGIFARYASWRLGEIIEYAHKLAEGNFRERLKRTGRGEFGVLSAKLNETSEKLQFMMQRLESEQSELEKLDQVRKDFVANVSHELRTPLASIQGYTETLLDGAIHDPANNVKFLGIIRQNAERLTRLTADLLVLSRVEQGQQKFKFGSYYINRLLQSDIEMMRPIAERRGIEISLDAATPSTEVFCDAEAVHQILTNLTDNAIKYTPDGGRVTVGVREIPGDFVEVYVRDSGLGIPPADLPRLFERFYRVDKARSRALGGTGLGLAIVKHLTRAQGGDVRVESKLDQGSTFFFTLPVRDLGLGEMGAVQQELTAP
jgi:two-component system, OmpR family, phosphate regulon sensor histidine kinase PhoR